MYKDDNGHVNKFDMHFKTTQIQTASMQGLCIYIPHTDKAIDMRVYVYNMQTVSKYYVNSINY